MYREFGTDMFAMLDAEFALILYDAEAKSFIAARDPIGIRPLYYGYDKNGVIVFASEPKNLVGLTERIMPFPPGHYYKDGKFTCYCDIAKVDEVCHDAVSYTHLDVYKRPVTGTDETSVVSIAEGAAGTDTFAAGSTYNWNGSAWEEAIVENELLTEEKSDVKEATVVESEQVNPEEITVVTLTEEV